MTRSTPPLPRLTAVAVVVVVLAVGWMVCWSATHWFEMLPEAAVRGAAGRRGELVVSRLLSAVLMPSLLLGVVGVFWGSPRVDRVVRRLLGFPLSHQGGAGEFVMNGVLIAICGACVVMHVTLVARHLVREPNAMPASLVTGVIFLTLGGVLAVLGSALEGAVRDALRPLGLGLAVVGVVALLSAALKMPEVVQIGVVGVCAVVVCTVVPVAVSVRMRRGDER
ncbi:MAG TPA: hypothetical protein VNJ54_06080 [Plantibacter sp.]|uniref:hypothetical protein n=1 Tax=unclassified Plantibacter TaxID=2624265 RepID=UPI002B61C175|nr:hypothetical protein [Plantibacter sp.]